jgi:hypothetical protein
MEQKRPVVISRSKWNRVKHGERSRCGFLLSSRGYCCLGFVCQQLFGATDEEMKRARMPEDIGIEDDLTGLPGGLVLAAAELNDRISVDPTNDLEEMTDAEQERRIAKLFVPLGIDLQFID